MNNTTVNEPPPSPIPRQMTGCLGIIAAVENIFILAAFLSNKHLLQSSSLVIGLTIGHAINGAVHAITAFQPDSNNQILVTGFYCIEIIWPNLFITVYQLLPVFLAMNGIERLLALGAPMWYRNNCTNRRLWLATVMVFIFGLLCMVANGVRVWAMSNSPTPASCMLPLIVGMSYMVYAVHAPAVMGGLCAITCTTIGVVIGRRRIQKMPTVSKSEIARVKKQVRLAKAMLMVSAIDIIFVVVPNIVLILYNMEIVIFPLRYTIYAVLIYCSDSVLNIIAFILFNGEFRRASMRLLTCGKKNEVGPTIINTASTPAVQAQIRLTVMKYGA